MKLNKWYDFYFENNGKCPDCGSPLFMSIGCYVGGAIFFPKDCSVYKKVRDEPGRSSHFPIKPRMLVFRKEINKRNNKNLDIQRKKSYIKIDN